MTTRWMAFTSDILDRCLWPTLVAKVRGHGFLCSECAGIVKALKKASK